MTDTDKSTTGGDAAAEPITKEYFMSLTTGQYEKLPPAQQQAIVRWLLSTPHNLKGRPQSTFTSTQSTKKGTTK